MIAVAKRLINREEYYKMAEVGILKPTDHVELINGEIIEMSPIGSRHAGTVRRMTRTLRRHLNESMDISIQSPVILNDHTEPEPDIAVVNLREDDYAESHPGVSDIVLIVEVSDSTLDYDQTTKARLYSQAGIVVYWIVNVDQGVITVHTAPNAAGYKEVTEFFPGDRLDFLGAAIDVNDLLIT